MQKNMAYHSPSIANKLTQRTADETADPMMALQWFHPYLTRHAADCMLIDNAPEGSYLLRASSDYQVNGSYVLSVKLSSSVQHIKISRSSHESGYKFGNVTFETVESFKKHFELEKPVIGSDSGVTVVLSYPYVRFLQAESHLYTDVVHHAVTNMLETSSELDDEDEEFSLPQPQAMDSKEGYLTKQGKIVKNWKTRWFILRSNILSYYKTKQSRRPIDRLDLSKATAVEYDNSKQKDYCFRVEFTHRTYYLYTTSAEDCDQWVALLRSKLPTTEVSTLPPNLSLQTVHH